MPPVDIYYKRRRVLRKHHTALESVICDIVAMQLTCTDDTGKPIVVTPEMVKVRPAKGSRRDVHTTDIEIRIFARDFKSRKPHYQRYGNELQDVVGRHLPAGTTIGVLYIPIAAWAAGVATGSALRQRFARMRHCMGWYRRFVQTGRISDE